MFSIAEKVFMKHVKGKSEFGARKSFPNYHFAVRKILELLGGNDRKYDNIISYLPVLRSRTVINSLDNMWKEICKHAGWFFIKTN